MKGSRNKVLRRELAREEAEGRDSLAQAQPQGERKKRQKPAVASPVPDLASH